MPGSRDARLRGGVSGVAFIPNTDFIRNPTAQHGGKVLKTQLMNEKSERYC